MVTSSRRTLRGSRDAADPPPSFVKRIQELERIVVNLERENRELRINQIVDLRVAAGLIPECERKKSQAVTSKLNDEALQVIRQDLLMFFSRLNAPTKSTGMESQSYVA